MPDDPNAQENIDIPPIHKETAGAVAGGEPPALLVGRLVDDLDRRVRIAHRLGPVAVELAIHPWVP